MRTSIRASFRSTISALVVSVMAALFVAACGGGDDDETSVSSTRVSLLPATLAPPASGSSSVEIGYAASTTTYPGVSTADVSAYVSSSTAASPSTDASNRVALGTCSLFGGSFSSCRSACVFSSERVLACGSNLRTLQPGNYALVGRVCVKNKSGQDVCGEGQTAFTVN
jgi:hypothetical protein